MKGFTASVIASAACRSPRERITQRLRRPSIQARKHSSTASPQVAKVLPHCRAHMPILNRLASSIQARW